MGRRLIAVLIGMLLLAFGGLSVHYTLEEDVEHHREWAERHDMPPPQPAITILGWVAVAAGAVSVASGLRQPRRK